ncbi:hypothetical protein CHUAL_010393 [Chamberlinius hualienensis]
MAAVSKKSSSNDNVKIKRNRSQTKFKKTSRKVVPKNVSAKKQADLSRSKLKRMKFKSKQPKNGVVYVGHIPYGFFEDQMRGYFSQFGEVRRLRLSRSKTTGKSRGYAFVQFEDDDVAKIAAETMNNYLMFERLLKCEYIPPERVHPLTFKPKGQGIIPYRAQALAKRRYNCSKTDNKVQRNNEKTTSKLNKLKEKLSSLGVVFNPNLVLKFEDKCENLNETDMIVDSSDDEVTFKTPPAVKKIKLKSIQKK